MTIRPGILTGSGCLHPGYPGYFLASWRLTAARCRLRDGACSLFSHASRLPMCFFTMPGQLSRYECIMDRVSHNQRRKLVGRARSLTRFRLPVVSRLLTFILSILVHIWLYLAHRCGMPIEARSDLAVRRTRDCGLVTR